MNKLLESLVMIVLGTLLVVFSKEVTEWLVMLCGMAFVLAGGFSIVGWLMRSKETRSSVLYPLVGVGSALFGLMLLIFPADFITALMYLLAVVLVVFGVVQCYSLWDMRRKSMGVHAAFFVVPLISLGVGLYILTAPVLTASVPFILIGVACVLHGLVDFISIVYVWHKKRKAAKEEVKVVVQDVESIN